MQENHIENLHFTSQQSTVDNINAKFYGRIKFPWPPQTFDRLTDAGFWARMLAQDIGSYDTPVPVRDIWVAGCGTNQALMTAMCFPGAQVVGSDLSRESLEVCGRNAEQLDVNNLELRRESINEVSYSERFDYVVCTGVIHHNADPKVALDKLVRAMRPSALLELMVYNSFHRTLTSAFQNAVRLLLNSPAEPDLDKELPVARKLVDTFRKGNLMSAALKSLTSVPDAAFADTLLQPVEHSYTIEELADLASQSGLEMLAFKIDRYSRSDGTVDWNLDFAQPELQKLYDTLDDVERWQVTNLLLGERSPLIWFYLQRLESPRPRKSEKQISEDFLRTKFRRIGCEKVIYSRGPDQRYGEKPLRVPFPGKPRNAEALRVYEMLDESAPLGETLSRLGVETTFQSLNPLRINLATSAFPFLVATDLG